MLANFRRQQERNFIAQEYTRSRIFPHYQQVGHREIRDWYDQHPSEFRTVDKVKFEVFDGDVHVDLRPDPGYTHLLAHDGQSLVVEIIPQDRSKVAVPAEGARIEVAGPWVEDSKHGWNEIHPAWWVSAGTIEPASAEELRRVQLLLQGVEGAAEEDDG